MKRNVNIKSMKYEDFNDNEYIEQMLKELRENGTNVIGPSPQAAVASNSWR